MPASNTKDCFREFVGQRVTGVIFDALPVADRSISAGTKTLIFEDGRGLLIHSNGSYGVVSAEDVSRAVRIRAGELKAVQRDLREVLALAGAGEKQEPSA